MQDVQNIPVPDSDSNEPNEGFGSHSEIREDVDNEDVEQVEDADDIANKSDVPTGFEQVPRDESERSDMEQI